MVAAVRSYPHDFRSSSYRGWPEALSKKPPQRTVRGYDLTRPLW
nr:MAG TPA: hypothetical protein [Caudoviricetes sp.]